MKDKTHKTTKRTLNTKAYALVIVFLFSMSYLTASPNKSKAIKEYERSAHQLFDDNQYFDAFPLYSHLVSIDPDNAEYCYKYGVCILNTGNREAAESISYLNHAAKKLRKNYFVYYYLGFAHHLNYQFKKAMNYYLKFRETAKSKELKKYEIDIKVEMCRNAKQIDNLQFRLQYVEKTTIKKENFYRCYNTSNADYKLILKPDELKTNTEKRTKENKLVCYSEENQVIYFSRYGNKKTGKDIYRSSKLPNGEWTKAEKLASPINTEYDEDYPYMSPDGKSFYFCSRGHNSIGGYDVFMSTFDPISYQWTEPININYLMSSNRINTPYDDFMFVKSPDSSYAYFSTMKGCKNGFVNYYKIQMNDNISEIYNKLSEKEIHKDILANQNVNNPNVAPINITQNETIENNVPGLIKNNSIQDISKLIIDKNIVSNNLRNK